MMNQERISNEQLQLFEEQTIRTAWNESEEEWYFAIVDVIGILTEAADYDAARNYWKVTKHRMIKEGNELVTICNQLKLKSPKDGKRYAVDVANTKQLVGHSIITSQNAEQFNHVVINMIETSATVSNADSIKVDEK